MERELRIAPGRSNHAIGGLSMGGFGTWSLAAAHPERWAAIAPICGGGDPNTAAPGSPEFDALRDDPTVRESYLGARREGGTAGYAKHKHYRRRRRWLS